MGTNTITEFVHGNERKIRIKMRPFYLLNRNDTPALSDKHRLLTYKQLLDEVLACKQILEDNGYGVGHRICIQGPNRVETWIWMIAASFDASGTTLPWNASEYTENARLKKNNANVVVRLNKDGTVKELDHKHFDKATTQTKEYMCQYSSGTTNKHGIPTCYSGVYELDEDCWGGDGRQAISYRLKGNPDFANPVTNRFLNIMQPYIPWSQDLTYHTLMMGGWVHVINDPSEYDSACEYQKPTWIIGFPLSLQKVMDANEGGHKINTLEFTGGIVTTEQQEAWQSFYNPDQYMNVYGEGSVGTYTVNFAKAGEDIRHVGKQLDWHKHSGGEVRIGAKGTVEVRGLNTPGDEWWDSDDLAEMTPEGNLNIIGRANEVIISRGGANIFPYEIAEFIGKHDKVNDCYLYKIIVDDERGEMPGCVYSGSVSPEHFYNYTKNKVEGYQVPLKFTRLKDTLPKLLQSKGDKFQAPKINLFFMSDTLKENSEWIVDEYEG
jgi:acyl-CoA synthetase (AMP-forming)/AMP-acid ligase II